MRITEVNIGNEYISNGLKPIFMNKLNQCVLIVGKNGSGKSRLLSQITGTLYLKPKPNDIRKASSQIKSDESRIKQMKEEVEKYKSQLLVMTGSKQWYIESISQYEKSIEAVSKEIEQLLITINWPLLKTDDYFDNYNTISFVPKNLNIKNSSNSGWSDLSNLANKAHTIGIEQMSDSTFAYIVAPYELH
jgi:predicted ATP-binding protein involved in virulence